MNMCLLKGGITYFRGTVRMGLGQVLGNPRLLATGHQMITNAKCQIAVGDAQRIIAQCLKQRQARRTSISPS